MPERCPRKHKHKVDGMRKTTQDLRTELSQEIETQKRTQAEMKMELKKNTTAQLENPKESFTSRTTQAKDRIMGRKDKIEGVDEINKGHKSFLTQERNIKER